MRREKQLSEAWFCNAGEQGNKQKGGGKTGGGLSKAGAADRECNVEHMQAAADSNGREKLARLPGLGNREKKREKEKGNGNWAGGLNWARRS